MTEEIFKELGSVLSYEPLIEWDIETCVTLIFYDFLFENGGSIESFDISREMMKSVYFNDKMLKRVEFRNVDIADKVVKVILKERWDTNL